MTSIFEERMINIVYVFYTISLFCGQRLVGVKGTESAEVYHPPILNFASSYIDVSSNSILEIECEGKYSLKWRLPENLDISLKDNKERVNISYSSDPIRGINQYVSTLVIKDLVFSDTGKYTCYYAGTSLSEDDKQNKTSLYVFVNDNNHVFVFHNQSQQFLPVRPPTPLKLPCLPTNSQANVTLIKNINADSTIDDVIFDPTEGFIINHPTIYYSGEFTCFGQIGNFTEKLNFFLFYIRQPDSKPQPEIDNSLAKQPVINGTFSLICKVQVAFDTLVSMKWDYPNKSKNDSRIMETKPTYTEKKLSTKSYRIITSKLIVTHVQEGDEGIYICSVTDHLGATNSHQVKIKVYETQQQPFINLTTDVTTELPVEHEAGKNIQLVVTIASSLPPNQYEIYWEKDSKLLTPTTEQNIITYQTQTVLTINNLKREDGGVYAVFGKSENLLVNISITFRVKAKPIATIMNQKDFYMLQNHYDLICKVRGYPLPQVSWFWKFCSDMRNCSSDSINDWINASAISTLQDEGTDTVLLHLDAIASVSGYYSCIGRNYLGESKAISSFFVSDAKNGFEIRAAPSEPVEQDKVTLTCLANILSYTNLSWRWYSTSHELNDSHLMDNQTGISVVFKSTQYSHSLTMVFESIAINNSGVYECWAWNNKTPEVIQKKVTNLTVRAIKKPFYTLTNLNNSETKAEHNKEFQLKCYSSGVPQPNITWYKDNQLFDAASLSGIEYKDDKQLLIFRRVVQNDAGTYECVAENKGGQIRAGTVLLVDHSVPFVISHSQKVIISVLVITGVGLFILAILLIKKICTERKYKLEMEFFSYAQFERGNLHLLNPNLPLDNQIELLPYDSRWEFPKEQLKLGRTLGQGAFGRVVKAEAVGLEHGETTTTVAVKMLKEHANADQKKALMAELKILILLGRHLNIVNLLGAVTKNVIKGELMMIVEYCQYGNLRHYLLQHQQNYINQMNPKTGKIDPNISTLPGSTRLKDKNKDNYFQYSSIDSVMAVENPTYKDRSLTYVKLMHGQTSDFTSYSKEVNLSASVEFTDANSSDSTVNSGYIGRNSVKEKGKNSDVFVSTCDLLCWAFQVSRGMEYLESRKLIHRDLAARNILLSKDNVVKICDFGLAKDCYKNFNYVKKGDGPLPVKWMAIESIRDKVFTIQSDVWSFGVLLWELFTLGGNPYPGIDVDEEFCKKLKNGYRMDKPEFCPSDVYKIMQNCWKEVPTERPDFTTLVDTFGNLLESSVRKYYVELNNPYEMMNEAIQNNNDYLTMDGTTTDYMNMKSEEQVVSKDVKIGLPYSPNHYDNIGTVRPVGDGPPPKEPMEVVPMIQLESVGDMWHDIIAPAGPEDKEEKKLDTLNIKSNVDYLLMTGACNADKKDNRRIKTSDSVFTDSENEMHSCYFNTALPHIV
ncbi:vascular endothelial growth factor receptor 1-like isoform X1 [Tachypleus tridentatus]|uniref:vascular endothelial growth factor receptor 1-like isoform X1 n=2 Tax=Tachypleus tridentatus TaxID=6853 RepID=UPI003FD5323D